MNRLTYDEVRSGLPGLDELRPVLDLLLSASVPNSDHRWAGSGELEAEGSRIVDADIVAQEAASLADRARDRLQMLYGEIGNALRALAEGDGARAARALLAVVALEERAGRPDRARACAMAAFRAGRDAEDRGPAAKALRRWGRAARALGDLDEARIRYEEGFEIARSCFDARGSAEAAIGVGNVLEQQGHWHEAAEWYERALGALDGLPEDAPERWQAMVNLHIVLRSAGSLGPSLPWLRRAEEEVARFGATDAVPFLENAWGQLHLWCHEFDKAEERFRTALEATTQEGARATIRLNLAESLLAQGRALDAAEQAREAEREALLGTVLAKLPEIYRMLGRIAAQEGNPDAFVLFEHALDLCREHRVPALERALTLQAYADAERARGETATADDLMDGARGIYRSLGIEHARHPWTDVYGRESAPRDECRELDRDAEPQGGDVVETEVDDGN